MKINLRYKGKDHVFREKPQQVGVCHRFNEQDEQVESRSLGYQPKGRRINLLTVPIGKRYFENDPRNTSGCNYLTAKDATLQELRDFHRTECACNKCK